MNTERIVVIACVTVAVLLAVGCVVFVVNYRSPDGSVTVEEVADADPVVQPVPTASSEAKPTSAPPEVETPDVERDAVRGFGISINELQSIWSADDGWRWIDAGRIQGTADHVQYLVKTTTASWLTLQVIGPPENIQRFGTWILIETPRDTRGDISTKLGLASALIQLVTANDGVDVAGWAGECVGRIAAGTAEPPFEMWGYNSTLTLGFVPTNEGPTVLITVTAD